MSNRVERNITSLREKEFTALSDSGYYYSYYMSMRGH